ncbi:putative papain-like cysteine peptidase superfamily [Helianthus annuus]|nr:putative papain-like cysteine peptidase superfamily [Helianthus annuus]
MAEGSKRTGTGGHPKQTEPIQARPIRAFHEKPRLRSNPDDVEIDPKQSTALELSAWRWLFRKRTKNGLLKQALFEMTESDPSIQVNPDDACDNFPYVMFEDMFGARVETIALQSLEIGSNVAGSVVDAWAHVLNGDPKFSIPGMPRRLFCVHTAVVDWMLSLETDPDGGRVSAFECGLKSSLAGRHHLLDLRAFDMVFVTMLEGDHYYLVVFDLEAECMHLVDHLGDRGSGALLRDDDSYIMKSTPFKVKDIFVDYLKLVNHPKATAMQASLIMREDLPWSTTRRIVAPFVESGIFAMRHMEQFVGSRRSFFCGFSVHGARKKVQCNYLRKRYAAEIMLSPVNKYGDVIRRRLQFV